MATPATSSARSGSFRAEAPPEGGAGTCGRRRTPTAPAGPGGKKNADIVAGGDATVTHMQNFFDCMRTRKEPNCPFEIGFRSAIACYMAITSYREKRTVRWDEKTEEVV